LAFFEGHFSFKPSSPVSKRKSTIDANLGKKEKAIRDLRRACISAQEILQTGAIHTALMLLDSAVREVSNHLLNKKSTPCHASPSSKKRLTPLRKPGTVVPKPSIKQLTGHGGSRSS